MSNIPKTIEIPGRNPDPVKLLGDLEGMDTDQKKYDHLRPLFLEEADVDEYTQYLDADEDIDLTKRQLKRLKEVMAGFNVYLKKYPEQTAEGIGRFEPKGEKNPEAMRGHPVEIEVRENLSETRRGIAKAMQILVAPPEVKGKSSREKTQRGPVSEADAKKELSPEETDKYLGELQNRFDALPKLHEGIKWVDVEKSLRADPESMAKMMMMDEKGHNINVFGEEKGELIFASAWHDIGKVAPEHKNICYDMEGQKWAEEHGYNPNGNAVDIAAALGVDLADSDFHERLRKTMAVNGGAWLKTDVVVRKTGFALGGYGSGIYKDCVRDYEARGALRLALRVKKPGL